MAWGLGWILLHDQLDNLLLESAQQIMTLRHGQQGFCWHHLFILTDEPGKDFAVALDRDIHALDRLLHQQDCLAIDDIRDDLFPVVFTLQIVFDIFLLEIPAIYNVGLGFGQGQIAPTQYAVYVLPWAEQRQTRVGYTLQFSLTHVVVKQHLELIAQHLGLVVVALGL